MHVWSSIDADVRPGQRVWKEGLLNAHTHTHTQMEACIHSNLHLSNSA